jgi:predicted cupin superfamily sugar epimerase
MCDGTAILEATGVELMDGKDYTAVAYLMENGTPTLGLFKNPTKPVARGAAKMVVRHTAAAPAVDVWVNGARVFTDLANGETRKTIVPKGIYAGWVSLPGDYLPVIGPEVVKVQKGFTYQIYAIGDATNGYDFAFIATKVGVK